MKRRAFFMTLCVSGGIFWWGSAFADDSEFSINISPGPISVVTEPGKPSSIPLRLQNKGKKEERFRVQVMKFKAFGETGTPLILDGEPGDDFLSWVSFSEQEFSVSPNEWKTITATFSPPESAAFGYYYALFFSRAGDPLRGKEGETSLSGGSVVLVLLEAKVPNAKREATVVEFHPDRKWYEFLPSTFSIRVKNSGTVHVAPRGNIFVSRPGNDPISILTVNGERGNILPDSFRIFESTWEDGFPVYRKETQHDREVRDADQNVVRKLYWDFSQLSKFRWGKYKAKLLLVYDDGMRDVPLEATTEFWVLPWKIFVAAGGIAIVLGVGIFSIFLKIWKNVFRKKATRSEAE